MQLYGQSAHHKESSEVSAVVIFSNFALANLG